MNAFATSHDRSRSCKHRIGRRLNRRLADIQRLWEIYQADPDFSDDELGCLAEYGLAFDYVAPSTFAEQREGYWRYQLSCGGPSDEFRFFASLPNSEPYRIEYWFLDWFDGAHRVLKRRDEALMIAIWTWFQERGQVQHACRQALESIGRARSNETPFY